MHNLPPIAEILLENSGSCKHQLNSLCIEYCRQDTWQLNGLNKNENP